jgi:uncharacterized repeat protein (TIGR01451 family)
MLKTKMFALVAATLALIIVPFASNAAQDVVLESSVNVANVTAGDTQYTKSVNAQVDDVVKIEVYIHNTELPDSGLVANNVRASIVIPTAPGTVQTIQSTVSSDNSNTVSDTATVNLSLATANLQYVPGSATWTHNVGTNTNVTYQTDKIGDAVVSGGEVLGNQDPCYNYESYVTVLARVMAPVVGITKTVKVAGSSAPYAATDSANPGDTLEYALVIKNYGNTTLNNVVVGDNLPPNLTYVPGSTILVDSNTGGAGKALVDGITTGGVYVDDMAVGASETIFLKAKIATTLACGAHALQNVGIVKATGVTEVYNVATTNVNVPCTPVPPKPPVTPPTPTTPLPDTGAGALAGVGGIGSIAYAGRAYLRSKKSLVDALRK